MKTYGYSISYDRDGNETSRTEPTFLSSLQWDDGSPFAERPAKRLSGNDDSKDVGVGFFSKALNWIREI